MCQLNYSKIWSCPWATKLEESKTGAGHVFDTIWKANNGAHRQGTRSRDEEQNIPIAIISAPRYSSAWSQHWTFWYVDWCYSLLCLVWNGFPWVLVARALKTDSYNFSRHTKPTFLFIGPSWYLESRHWHEGFPPWLGSCWTLKLESKIRIKILIFLILFWILQIMFHKQSLKKRTTKKPQRTVPFCRSYRNSFGG